MIVQRKQSANFFFFKFFSFNYRIFNKLPPLQDFWQYFTSAHLCGPILTGQGHICKFRILPQGAEADTHLFLEFIPVQAELINAAHFLGEALKSENDNFSQSILSTLSQSPPAHTHTFLQPIHHGNISIIISSNFFHPFLPIWPYDLSRVWCQMRLLWLRLTRWPALVLAKCRLKVLMQLKSPRDGNSTTINRNHLKPIESRVKMWISILQIGIVVIHSYVWHHQNKHYINIFVLWNYQRLKEDVVQLLSSKKLNFAHYAS